MEYRVVLTDGRRFGPADIETLNKWIVEGRVNQSTVLEDATTGATCEARSVEGLVFPGQAPRQSPTEGDAGAYSPTAEPSIYADPPQPVNHYPRSMHGTIDDGRNDLTWSFVCSFGSVALVCCFPIAIGGIVLGTRAKSKGNANGNAAIAVGWIAIAIGLLFWIFSFSGIRDVLG